MSDAPICAAAQWRALGTYVQLAVRPAERGQAALERARAVLADVDRTCSRFRQDSDLSRVNRSAGYWVMTSPLFRDALSAALGTARDTGGLVDPTLGVELERLGYDRDFAAVRPGSADAATVIPLMRPPGTWRDVEVRGDGRVRVPFGRALDLGATGKAYAADMIARTVARSLGVHLAISLGGDVAIGRPPGALHEPDWKITVREQQPGGQGGGAAAAETAAGTEEVIALTGGAVATSSIVHRRWQSASGPAHHLLDPRTGRPATPFWRTVSVLAGTCVAANAASTAAIVLGPDAVAWLSARGLAARLVHRDGQVLRVGGWPQNATPVRARATVARPLAQAVAG